MFAHLKVGAAKMGGQLLNCCVISQGLSHHTMSGEVVN